jgi:alkanesulfonate monooxygenase SsuD/methylene tetrahydromethanopterin reductase-like flavin-dependent oxidoreductase (luciferase family)
VHDDARCHLVEMRVVEGALRRFEAQVGRIREIWANARRSDRDAGVLGPAPVQEPGPPVLASASTPSAIERAARVADGFLFGTAGSEAMQERAPGIRELFARNGKPDTPIVGLAYVGVGDDPDAALAEATHHVLRSTASSGRSRRRDHGANTSLTLTPLTLR